MTNGNGRPLSKRKQVQFLIGLTILAWATQTLLHQWGFGQEAPGPATQPGLTEKFVPGTARFASGATLEIRSEATVFGAEVKVSQICRWSDADAEVLAPIGDLVLARLSADSPFRGITVSEIKTTLHDAGVNVAAINFVGATSCTVNRSDVEYNEATALEQWAHANHAKAEPPATAPALEPIEPAPAVAMAPPPDPQVVQEKQFHTLRESLTLELTRRLNLPAEQLQLSFRPQDEKTLNLAEPLFKFEIDSGRARNLGEIAWAVTVVADNGTTRRVMIPATARAWETQTVVASAVAPKQVLREEDLIERRALVSRLSDDFAISRGQAVGQQAARELKPGTVLTARMVDAAQLVRAGQFVTIIHRQGNVTIKTVARATEAGSFGQTIRVKNEATRDVYQVIVTGPQEATLNSAPPTRVAGGQSD
ncbi:MAG: flagellar basal body P-ring formation chaperone FlgA [Tepidisphaeraceae bacterium]